MTEDPALPLLNHELADDELAWMQAVYEDFGKIRAAFSGREKDFDPKQALRDVLASNSTGSQPMRTCPAPAPGGSARIAMAVALPLSSCRGSNCTGTREAEPTSFPCMWSARQRGFPSARTDSPC